jgi:hypothetical protein
MHVQIERGVLRGRRLGQEQQQSCEGGNLHNQLNNLWPQFLAQP